MEEAQRPTVDLVAVPSSPDGPLVQIPVRDVASGIGQDEVVEEHRHEVDPALIDELATVNRHAAVAREL
jgi:hypothetical protein